MTPEMALAVTWPSPYSLPTFFFPPPLHSILKFLSSLPHLSIIIDYVSPTLGVPPPGSYTIHSFCNYIHSSMPIEGLKANIHILRIPHICHFSLSYFIYDEVVYYY